MLKRRDTPAHRVARPLKKRRNDVRIADSEVDPGTEVLLDPPLVEEGEVVFGWVDGRLDERDVESVPL